MWSGLGGIFPTLIQEAAENFANVLTFDEFQELQERMIADGAPEVPASAAAIPELALVRNLPTLAPCAALDRTPKPRKL